MTISTDSSTLDLSQYSVGDVLIISFKELTTVNDFKCIFYARVNEGTSAEGISYIPLSEYGRRHAQTLGTGTSRSTGFYPNPDKHFRVFKSQIKRVTKLDNTSGLTGHEKTLADDIIAYLE